MTVSAAKRFWTRFSNAPTMILFFVLGAFVVYGILYDPSASSKALQGKLQVQCEKARARAQVFADFANEAAAARRRTAESDFADGKPVLAENELATARRYEGFAVRYLSLTTQDCADAYKLTTG